MSIGAGRAARLQLGAWATALTLCLGALLHATFASDAIPFVRTADGPAWIMAPMPLTSDLIAVDASNPPPYTFVRRFDATGDERDVRLSGHALRNARVELNGRPIELETDDSSWRDGLRADLPGALRVGRNELRVSVTNSSGRPLLSLRLESGGGPLLDTDERWQVIVPRHDPIAAVIARDTAIHPESRALPGPGQLLSTWWPVVLTFFVLGAAAAFAWPRISGPNWPRRMPAWTLAAMTLFWLVHFLWKLGAMPMMVGFDLPAHLVYIDYLREHHSIPTADHGFSTYHPPLFYLLTTLVVMLFDASREGMGAALAYRTIPWLAGLANIWLTWLAARRVWPAESLRPSLAVAFAGLLPMNIYVSSYVSNESLHAALVSLAFCLAISILLAASAQPRRLIALALVLGLGLLTKFTSLLVAPAIAGTVALRTWWVDGQGAPRALAHFAALMAGAALVAGWFYLRNWMYFGDPVVWNLDVPGAATWWMQPGFHTPAWYGSFGESLSHPFFSGYASFWDGIYSTFWGDGLAGGMIRLTTRHGAWNYDFMTIGYWLALPATGLIAAGFVGMLRESYREQQLGRRLVLFMTTALIFGLAFSLLYLTLSLPFYAQAKAFYGLAAVAPLSLVAAQGLAWIPLSTHAQRDWVRAAYFGWLTALGGTIVVTYLG